MNFDLFSLNAAGLGKANILLAVLNQCTRQKSNNNFIICLQEMKCSYLKNAQKALLDKFKLDYHFNAATGKSGGLLILWSKNLGTTSLFSSKETCQLLHFCDLDITVCNVYMSWCMYVDAWTNLQNTLNFVHNSAIILAGDFNAFDCQKENTSNALRQNDVRISRFKKLSEVLEKHCLFDFALFFSNLQYTHFDKRQLSPLELTTSLLEVQPNLTTCKCIEILTETITYYTSVHQRIALKEAQVTGNSMKVSLSPITSFFLNI